MTRKPLHQDNKAGRTKQRRRTPFFVVLDNIRSVYNVGAIFRTSDAVLAEKLYLCGITGHPPRKDLEKTALGATNVIDWEYRASTKDLLLKLKKKGVALVGLELTKKSVNYREAEFRFPMALVLGNEVEGVGKDLLPLMDMVVSIPMLGKAKSLNVATAYGIVAYEILHQYGSQKK